MSRKRMPNSLELLFVAGSSRDRKGKRVLIRDGAVENTIWDPEEFQDSDIGLLGLSQRDRQNIAMFLKQQSDNAGLRDAF